MRSSSVLAALLLLAGCAIAHAEEPPKLDEMDALRIKVLTLERSVIEQRSGRISAEGRVLLLENATEYAAKAKELDAVIEGAARKAGVDPKAYQPDPGARIWRPR